VIVLDTNVISEILRPRPEPRVQAWLERLEPGVVRVAAVTCAELWYGVRLLPEGRRRARLVAELHGLLHERWPAAVLAFDAASAEAYATLRAARRAAGHPMAMADAMIAGTASAYGATVATRNIKDFADCGVPLVDPWAG